MNKKVMAVAVAAALAVPAATAMAQTSTVQIGGSFNLLWYYHKPDNPNVGKKGDTLHMSEPEIFIRGEEKLGGALGSVWFQCASEADIVSGDAFGLCHRNSAIGFRGSFGNVFWGNWDVPHKLVTNQIRGAFSGTNALYGGGSRLLHNGSASGVPNPPAASDTEGSNAHSFYRRQSNLVSYHSPSWNGFMVQGAFSSANEHTGLGLSPLEPRLYSFAGHYRNGPLYVGAAFERHQDYNPAQQVVVTAVTPAGTYRGGDDDSWQIGAAYTFAGVFKLSGMYTRNEYETTMTTKLKTKGWAIYGDWNIQGPHIVRMAYAKQDDTSGNSPANVGTYVGP
ncbi:MAG: porin, partial [Burkholderiales bacterium]